MRSKGIGYTAPANMTKYWKRSLSVPKDCQVTALTCSKPHDWTLEVCIVCNRTQKSKDWSKCQIPYLQKGDFSLEMCMHCKVHSKTQTPTSNEPKLWIMSCFQLAGSWIMWHWHLRNYSRYIYLYITIIPYTYMNVACVHNHTIIRYHTTCWCTFLLQENFIARTYLLRACSVELTVIVCSVSA